MLNKSCDARSKVAVVKRSAYNSAKFTINFSEIYYIMLRAFHHSGSNAKEEEWNPSRPPIVNPRFNATQFRFSFFLSLSLFCSIVARTLRLRLVRPRPLHSRLLSPVLWMRLGRAPVHPRETIVSTFVHSHNICIPYAATNTDARSRVNTRRASVSIPTCELCS